MSIPVVILIFLFVFLLIFGANLVVVGLRRISHSNGERAFALSAILLALATSFPELSVAITSGIEGNSSLSLGNVLGANIANLTLVSGGAALIAGRAVFSDRIMHREAWLAILAGISPLAFLIDGVLSRVDGLILIVFWGVYVAHFFRIRFLSIAKKFREEGFWYRFLHRVEVNHRKEWVRLLAGVAILLFSADVIVRLAEILAQDAKIPLFLVGVFVVALGTTLPELAFSFRSLTSGEPTVFLGNIMGSIIANSTLIVGIASVLSPITVSPVPTFLAGFSFTVIYLLFLFFIRTKQRLDRWEAGVLLGVYILFVLLISR